MIINNSNSVIYETCIEESLTFFNEKFSFNPIEMIKKAFKWILDKINKAINFIKDKLKKKKKDAPKDSKTYSLEKPFRKPRSNKSKEINIDGPIKSGGGNRLALDNKTHHRPRGNKTKEINIDGPIELGDSSRPFVKVSNDFVKKCTIYLNADNMSKHFFKNVDDIINKLKSNTYNIKTLDNKLSFSCYGILDLEEELDIISKYNFKCNTTLKNIGFKKRVVFRSNNSNMSDIMFIYNPNIDILRTMTDFRNNVKQNESKMINIVKNLENTEENKSKISDINKIMNEFKKKCSFFISQLTRVADFDIDYELNKILPKGV